MSEVSITEARERFADVVDQARLSHEPVFLTQRGERVAAVVDATDLEQLLLAAQDLADLRSAAETRLEIAADEAPVHWDVVKRDLDLL